MTLITRYSSILLIVFVIAIASAFGQTERKDDSPSAAPGGGTPQTVNAQQSGAWTVGIDPAKNTVKLTNTPSDPLAVKLVNSGSARKPFQFRMNVSPIGTGNSSEFYQLPAGKRLVIENVSAVARMPEGMKMEVSFYCYFDNGDGIPEVVDLTFHRIAFIDQGFISPFQIMSANHKVLIFADGQIGAYQLPLVVQARLSVAAAPGVAQAQLTFSGYIEDLPTAP